MTGRAFSCECCGKLCLSDWTEAEAREEAARAFPGSPPDELSQVCDDCYEMLMKCYHPRPQ